MVERPGWQTVAREARAAPEFASFAMAAGPLLAVLPRGDGHAVLVLPGLGGSDASTAPLRWFIGRLGYRSYGWGLGTNRGFGRHVTDGLDELVAANHEHGPVSLVGWSLGGVHAIELARRRPDAVRSVVTLGSPLHGRRPPTARHPHHIGVQPKRCHRRLAHVAVAERHAARERRGARESSRPRAQPCRRRRDRRSSLAGTGDLATLRAAPLGQSVVADGMTWRDR
jgi:pimeloyl-ACP methyl ester carboxylesterase